MSGDASAYVTASTSTVSNNMVSAAGFVATGGQASAGGNADTSSGINNRVLGTGLPFINQTVVSQIVSTVLGAGEARQALRIWPCCAAAQASSSRREGVPR